MRWEAVVAVIMAGIIFLAGIPAGNATITYRLKKGEGLADVSRRYGVPLNTLIKANRKRLPRPANPNYVYTGMAVSVPGISPKPAPLPKTIVKAPEPKTAPKPVAPEASPVNPSVSKSASPVEPVDPSDRIFPPDKGPSNLSPEARAKAEEDERDGSFWGRAGINIQSAMPWIWLAVAVFSAAIIYALARKVSQTLSAAESRDSGMLRLIASRDLGRHSKIYWFRAGERDLFITQGADAQIITIESPPEPEPIAAFQSPLNPSTRRPRKNNPSDLPDDE